MAHTNTVILASEGVPETRQLLPRVRQIVESNSNLIATLKPGEEIPKETERVVVIGGDGTLINAIRTTLDCEVPVLGVNAGRLGVLAEFDTNSLERNAKMVFGDQPLVRKHLVVQVSIQDRRGTQRFQSVAVNDCVISAGPPFRMIELSLKIDQTEGPSINGDGLIIASPIGSTAYNVSAGGPIVQPTVDALIISAVAPHSLSFRPIVADAETVLEIGISRANSGTTLVLDGQETHPLEEGERLIFRRHLHHAGLIGNPESPYWNTLIEKMRWGAPPTYRDRGT